MESGILRSGNTESRGNINALNCHGWDLQSNLGSKSTQNLQKSSKSCDLKILFLDSRRGTRKWLDSVNTNRCGMVRNRLTFILVKIAPLQTSLESFVTPTVPSLKKYVICCYFHMNTGHEQVERIGGEWFTIKNAILLL